MADGHLAPHRTALLLVDVQRDFAAADGLAGRDGADLSAVEPAVERMERLAASARRAGVAVVFSHLVTRPETDPPVLAALLARRGASDQLGVCRAGSPGAAPYRLVPQPGDMLVEKRLYGGFSGTDLAAQLHAAGRDTLVVAGLTTECCVLATALEGFHAGFHIVVASDACAAYEATLHQGALAILGSTCALIESTDAVTAAWAEPAR